MSDDAHVVGKGRWKVPAGSVAIDIGLVLMMVFTAGQMTKTVETLDQRLLSLESRANGLTITPEAARRIAVLEEQSRQAEADRRETRSILRRIEDKLDAHMDNNNNHARKQ